MAETDARAKPRIDQLDVLRGIAILGILLLNLPPAATTILAAFDFPQLAPSWTATDQAVWRFLEVGVEGTQRGLLQLLFGASMLILTARAMQDEGPVIVADLYYRRNLWLLLFGLLNIFVLLFPGDILFVYALAALFLFPFRRLGPKTLLAIGLSWSLLMAVLGGIKFAERAELAERVSAIQQQQAAGGQPQASDKEALKSWDEARKSLSPDRGFMAADAANRRAPFPAYASWMHGMWLERAKSLELLFEGVPEAFAVMLIGAALFKWQILQGRRSRRFYLLAGAAAYAFGLSLRFIAAEQHLTFNLEPRLGWITDEPARLAVTFGHVCLVSLILASAAGRRLLSPLKAAGRTAFSLYLMQSVIIMWLLFPSFGLGLWGKLGWAEMVVAVGIVAAVQIVLANLWLRYFATGPVEWVWRSLVEMRRQPFRR